jgi:hypothetical protein
MSEKRDPDDLRNAAILLKDVAEKEAPHGFILLVDDTIEDKYLHGVVEYWGESHLLAQGLREFAKAMYAKCQAACMEDDHDL